MQSKPYPAHVLRDTLESYLATVPGGRRPVYLAALAGLVLALASLPLIHVPVSVQAPGLIRPTVEKSEVRVPVSGRISAVLVRQNQRVDQGAPLAEMETAGLEDRSGTARFRLDQVNASVRDLQLLAGSDPAGVSVGALATPKYRRELEQLLGEREELALRARDAERALARSTELRRRGLVSVAEAEERSQAVDEARVALRTLVERYRNRWQSELAQLNLDRRQLESELAQVREQRALHRIAAPVTGTVEEMASVAPGSFLQAGDRLAVISPDSTKVAELYVSPRDVGLVRVGMPVRLQIDAFRYTEWGFVPARVSMVADDFTLVDQVPVFRVRCVLEQDRLRLPNGATGVVKKGMTLRAHFMVARRSLFDLLRDDVSDWIDPRDAGSAPK